MKQEGIILLTVLVNDGLEIERNPDMLGQDQRRHQTSGAVVDAYAPRVRRERTKAFRAGVAHHVMF